MSACIQETIDLLEAEIEAMEQRCGELHRVIEALRPLSTTVDDPAPPRKAPRGRQQVARASKRRASKVLEHPNRDQERTDAVMAFLDNGPLSTKEIAKRLHQDRKVVKMALQRLKKAGRLEQTGVGPGTKWVLPRRAPVRSTFPAPTDSNGNGKTKAARERTSAPATVDVVERRDAALLRYLDQHDGIASAEQLKAAMPVEAGLDADARGAAFHAALTRLKTKGKIERTGNTWSRVGIAMATPS